MNCKENYLDYIKKLENRAGLYKLIADKFNIKKALYPGSYIDITPSFFIEDVTYIDNFKNTDKFFKNINSIIDFINENKKYDNELKINFIYEDYRKKLEICNDFDLIISQYGGIISPYVKNFLKSNGIYLCNDSHADATITYFDNDFDLLGIINYDDLVFREDDKDIYFQISEKRKLDFDILNIKMKPPKYINNADNYVFKKL
ncbi:hypothetical protein SZ52_00680 [Brachyspira hyodysenteriae]|uniref:hypothetical protein n=1 Tax=Brachyspira hyodysenteriae TaxID=159 RepID=UPI00063DA9DB|nr:hypothetical protein [Brachyspira hyodysenteriae]KLI44851.1 hypothetical protein SZ52_00680 [Brachyspira hyodysenteriae]